MHRKALIALMHHNCLPFGCLYQQMSYLKGHGDLVSPVSYYWEILGILGVTI